MMRFILTGSICLFFCHCSSLQQTTPRCDRSAIDLLAVSNNLSAARANWNILNNPAKARKWAAAEVAYNNEIEMIFVRMRCREGSWKQRASDMNTAIGTDIQSEFLPDDADSIFPADQTASYKKARNNLKPGFGIPAIAWRPAKSIGAKENSYSPPAGISKNLTLILDFSQSKPVWRFIPRDQISTFRLGRTSRALAANWTAPTDFYWAMSQMDNLSLLTAFVPDRFTTDTGLYFQSKYDPTKIPVVMVHGLASSPETYRYIVNDLNSQPWFRENYQIWTYHYPTGVPWLYSSMTFRQNLEAAINYAAARGGRKNLDKMVILAHSMGGLLARGAITDPMQKLYDAHFSVPFSELKVTNSTRKLIRDGLLYQPLTAPKRVVFMAVPHQGSPLANLRATSLLSQLIRLPKKLTVGLLDATVNGVVQSAQSNGALTKVRLPTSISSLSPISRGFDALRQMPLPSQIKFHSIIGDKGHNDTPNSSDGVVPYWSSHITPIQSELIVDSNHSVTENPEASLEVQRILQLHLKEIKDK